MEMISFIIQAHFAKNDSFRLFQAEGMTLSRWLNTMTCSGHGPAPGKPVGVWTIASKGNGLKNCRLEFFKLRLQLQDLKVSTELKTS